MTLGMLLIISGLVAALGVVMYLYAEERDANGKDGSAPGILACVLILFGASSFSVSLVVLLGSADWGKALW
jgi:hypothetical protein